MELEEAIKQTKFKSVFQKAMLNLLFTNGWLSNLQNQFFKSYGISAQQFNVLRILRGQHPKPASMGLVKDRMLDKMSNSSRLVEKLRLKGLLERNECESDRRQVDILITNAGLDLLAQIDQKIESLDDVFRALSEKEATELNRLLNKLRG